MKNEISQHVLNMKLRYIFHRLSMNAGMAPIALIESSRQISSTEGPVN